MNRKPKDICLLWMLSVICIGVTSLVACTQTNTIRPTIVPGDSPTFVPVPSEMAIVPTPSAFVTVREHPLLREALFVVLSDDQTRLLAAYEGEVGLRVLYQFPLPSYRAQVTFYPADFPVISRDGVWVTVVENEERATFIHRISLIGPDEPATILNWPGCQAEATISPDGKRVAFLARDSRCTRHGEAYSPMHVYVMDSDGSNVKRITTEAADRCFLTWSPNSAQVAYREVCDPAASAPPQVYVVTLEPFNNPRQVTQITASGALAVGVNSTWSPSGEWLQWVTYRNGVFGVYRLSRLDAEGKVLAEIASSLEGQGIWSPDSKRLARITGEDRLIAIWDIESGEVVTSQLPTNIWPFDPRRWLSDGKRLVFAGQRIDGQGNLVPGRKWFMVDIDGTNLVEFEAP